MKQNLTPGDAATEQHYHNASAAEAKATDLASLTACLKNPFGMCASGFSGYLFMLTNKKYF